jgi:hypothetical protein
MGLKVDEIFKKIDLNKPDKEDNPNPVILDLPTNEIQMKIDKVCKPGMEYPDLTSIIGILTRNEGISFDALRDNAEYISRYMHPQADHRSPESVAKVIEDLKKPYHEQVGKGVKFVTPSGVEFIPTWDNKPPFVPPVLKLAGVNILTFQNISAIIASPGSGKTSCIEAIGASFLNPIADCLGFEVDKSCKGVIIIDTERTKNDVWNSFYRMCRRAGIPEGNPVRQVTIVGMRGISDTEERKNIIEKYIKDKDYSLLLIDGVADLVRDTNNIEQAKSAQDWLRYLTATYDLSILCTIHPNPGSTKARGNTGGETLRDSETVLLIKDYEGAKILTSDFEHGKNRNTGKLSSGFRWSDEKMMFVSVDHDELIRNKKGGIVSAKISAATKSAQDILPPPSSLRFTDLVSAIMIKEGVKERTAKERIRDWSGLRIISNSDGLYRYVI